MTHPRVLVVTVVHRPHDARILHRQIEALLTAGWEVTYAAPWAATDQEPPSSVRPIDLPRAEGQRRLRAVRAARTAIGRLAGDHDVVLLHDPELLLSTVGLDVDVPIVWDVHEDPAAALRDREWVPRWARGALRLGIRAVERWAERRHHLLLAERGYASRFRYEHPTVPNVPTVPDVAEPPGRDRVVHLGRHSRSRGAEELVALAGRLAPEGVRMELLGYADPEVEPLLREAARDGRVLWTGFVRNDEALARLPGALAGLSLLHDQPNFRSSMPTKVLEYLAHGVPIVTTPLPEAVAVVERHGVGSVVPFGDVDAAAAAILALRDEADLVAMHERARAAARNHHDWSVEGPKFVAHLAAVADR